MARRQELEVLRIRKMALLSPHHLQMVSLLFNVHRLRLLALQADPSPCSGNFTWAESVYLRTCKKVRVGTTEHLESLSVDLEVIGGERHGFKNSKRKQFAC